MANSTVEEPPATWLALSRKLGVPQPLVSQTARSLLTMRTSGPIPAMIPSPVAMGQEFVAELTEVITNSSIRRKVLITQGESRVKAVDLDRQIREVLDENAHMIGDNLIEFVADKLSIPRSVVQRVMKERYDALCFERKIKAAEAAYQAEQQILKRAKLGRRSEAADNSREAALGAHRQRPLPTAYKPAAPAPPVATLSPKASLERPACFPQPHENKALDDALCTAWIQGKAGMVNERLAAELELMNQYPPAAIDQAYDAIELSYSSRSEKGKREMDRKAAKLAKARAEQTNQATPQTTAPPPSPPLPRPTSAKKT